MNADLAVVLSPGAEQAGLGWLLSWLGWLAGLAYKVPDAACRKIPCPSAAAQRAVGPQPNIFL